MARCFELRQTAELGAHLIALRAVRKGETVLIEAPLVSTRTAAPPGLPSVEPEWQLVHALLATGKRPDWAEGYARAPPDAGVAESAAGRDILGFLTRAHAVGAADVLMLYDVVRANAFGLETPLLSREYGAAFYETACRLNHACAPNCTSLRLGGNFALYAVRPIAVGEELRHSYLPPTLLLMPTRVRAAHLLFECACARCAACRRDSSADAALLSLRSAPARADGAADGLTGLGSRLALALASSDTGEADGESDNLVRAMLSHGLSSRPLAATEMLAPYLSACCARLASRGAAGGSADVAGAAAAQYLTAVGSVDAVYRSRHAEHAPGAALGIVRARAELLHALIAHADDPGSRHALVRRAICRMADLFGGGVEWARDDMPLLDAAAATAGVRDALHDALAEAQHGAPATRLATPLARKVDGRWVWAADG